MDRDYEPIIRKNDQLVDLIEVPCDAKDVIEADVKWVNGRGNSYSTFVKLDKITLGDVIKDDVVHNTFCGNHAQIAVKKPFKLIKC